MGVNGLPMAVIQEPRDCDLNLGPFVPESSMLTTQLPSHPNCECEGANIIIRTS